MNNWNGSKVMADFVKIAEEGLITTDFIQKNYVGNPSKSPVGPFRHNPDIKHEKVEDLSINHNPCKNYDITKETGKELIEKAHGKSPTMADAMGEGALIENEQEAQEKDIEVATKMPNGALVGVHASLINELVKLANALDDAGKYEEAKRVDDAIGRISGRPFDKTSAWWFIPSLIGGIATGFGTGTFSWLGQKLTSFRESLPVDIKDLVEVFETAEGKGSKTASEATSLLNPFIQSFSSIDLKNPKDFEKYTENVQKLYSIVPKLEQTLAKVKMELGSGKWYHFGTDITSRIEGKLNDIRDDLEEANKLIEQARGLEDKAQMAKGGGSVSDLQKLLFEKGFDGKVWKGAVSGNIDENTASAVAELEKMLDEKMKKHNINVGSMSGQILQNGKLTVDISKLNEIVDLTEKL